MLSGDEEELIEWCGEIGEIVDEIGAKGLEGARVPLSGWRIRVPRYAIHRNSPITRHPAFTVTRHPNSTD